MRAAFSHLVWENQTRTIASFYFKPAGRYRYDAGQYAVFDVPHSDADSRGTSRTMTLSTSPHESLISFTARLQQSGSSSFKRQLLQLKPGSEIILYDAMGDLVLPLDAAVPLVFVAGGVGIASFVGMIKWLSRQRDKRNITLFYAASQPSELVLLQIFQEYAEFAGMTIHLYLSQPTLNQPQSDELRHLDWHSRRLTAADTLPAVSADSLLYISGPENMVEAIRHDCLKLGVSSQQIIFDYFDGY